MENLKTLLDKQVDYDKKNNINYDVYLAKIYLINSLTKLEISSKKNNREDMFVNISSVMAWTIRLLNSCSDYISTVQVERLDNYFIDYKNKNEIKNSLDLIYNTLRGDKIYHYLTYDHFKFFLKDLMIYFNYILKIKKVALIEIYETYTLNKNIGEE